MRKLYRRIFTISAVVIFIIIAGLSSYASFIAENVEKLNSFIYSPIYIIPWFILILLIIIYPWLIEDNKKLISFITLHLPFLILFCMIIISFITNKSYIFKLKEGESKNIKEISLNAGVIFNNDTFIKLNDFIIERYKTKKKEIKNYKSFISIDSKQNEVIEINKPLNINNISIYQKSFSIGAKEISFSLDGKTYDIFDQEKGVIKTDDGYYFEIFAKDLIGDEILYKWKILDENFEVFYEGTYLESDEKLKKDLKSFYDFYFIKQEYLKISVLELSYKPAKLYLFIASIIFLLSIIYSFWGVKFIKKWGIKNDN